MAGPGDGRSWNAVRRAVRRECRRTSLRAVAREIGIAHATVDYFRKGGTPHPRIAEPLEKWFLDLAPERRDDRFEIEELIVERVLDGLAGEVRERAFRRFLDLIRQSHREQGTTPPDWVRWMRERGPPPADGSPGDAEAGDTDE